MVYLVIKTTSDGYDDRWSSVIGAYSNEVIANEKKDFAVEQRKLLEQRIKDADEREAKVYKRWEEEKLFEKYYNEGMSHIYVDSKFYKEQRIARGGVDDFLSDDMEWYKVIPIEVDSDNFKSIVL